jgi:hypothetical protein
MTFLTAKITGCNRLPPVTTGHSDIFCKLFLSFFCLVNTNNSCLKHHSLIIVDRADSSPSRVPGGNPSDMPPFGTLLHGHQLHFNCINAYASPPISDPDLQISQSLSQLSHLLAQVATFSPNPRRISGTYSSGLVSEWTAPFSLLPRSLYSTSIECHCLLTHAVVERTTSSTLNTTEGTIVTGRFNKPAIHRPHLHPLPPATSHETAARRTPSPDKRHASLISLESPPHSSRAPDQCQPKDVATLCGCALFLFYSRKR